DDEGIYVLTTLSRQRSMIPFAEFRLEDFGENQILRRAAWATFETGERRDDSRRMQPRMKTRLPLLDRPYIFDQVVFSHRDNPLIPLLHAEVISPDRHVTGAMSGPDFVSVDDPQDAEILQMAIVMFRELRQIRRPLFQRICGGS